MLELIMNSEDGELESLILDDYLHNIEPSELKTFFEKALTKVRIGGNISFRCYNFSHIANSHLFSGLDIDYINNLGCKYWLDSKSIAKLTKILEEKNFVIKLSKYVNNSVLIEAERLK